MGACIDDNLIKNERVIHYAYNHWIIFVSLRSFLSLFILPLIDNWTSEYAITNMRVIMKVGLISRRTIEMNVQKVESVNVNQSIFGRILGYGDISVVGTGGSRETFEKIADPIRFKRTFQEVQNETP